MKDVALHFDVYCLEDMISIQKLVGFLLVHGYEFAVENAGESLRMLVISEWKEDKEPIEIMDEL